MFNFFIIKKKFFIKQMFQMAWDSLRSAKFKSSGNKVSLMTLTSTTDKDCHSNQKLTFEHRNKVVKK